MPEIFSPTIIYPVEGLLLLCVFGVLMSLAVFLTGKKDKESEGFLVCNRDVSVFKGALSIAVSWIWAPAIFICALQSYSNGIAGIFWFTFPNVLCFFVFTPLAIKVRKIVPFGYSFPHYIAEKRYPNNAGAHLSYLLVAFGYQLGAIVINLLAGGTLLHAISGLDISLSIILFTAIPLLYTLGTGLKASIFTDVIQMGIVLIVALILIPWTVILSGGWDTVQAGVPGISGKHGSILDSQIAWAMGIPMTLGLIAGPISDQMFFQRAMATKPDKIAKTFIYGGLLFGLIPIMLSLLGFIAVPFVQAGILNIADPQLVGLEVIKHFLPLGAVYAFLLMAFAGLCSTLDSAFCAISSLGTVDIFKRYWNPTASDAEVLRASRFWMLIFAVFGTSIALLQPKLLWVFLIYGALASAGLFPTILTVFWEKLPAWGATWGIISGLAIGTPLSIYANIQEDVDLIVYSAIASVCIGLIVCISAGILNSKKEMVDNDISV